MIVYGVSMDNSLIQELENEVDKLGVPVCGANISIIPLPRNVCGYLLFQNSSGLHVRD